jgi:hypothetical protein
MSSISSKFKVVLFIGLSVMASAILFPAMILAQPPIIRKIVPLPPGLRLPPVDFAGLQKEAQNLRLQRDRLEKDIDTSVGHLQTLKKELKKADNPVTKFFYRQQLESQYAIFRNKIEQLDAVESRLSIIIRELGTRFSNEPGPVRPNLIPAPPTIPGPILRPLVLPPVNPPPWVSDPELLPLGFNRWTPDEKAQFIKQEIARISEQKKQLQSVIRQHQKDIDQLKKILDEVNPPEGKSQISNPNTK